MPCKTAVLPTSSTRRLFMMAERTFSPFAICLMANRAERSVTFPNLLDGNITSLSQFDVTLSDATSQAQTSGRPPKVFKVTLTKAAEINPE